MKRIIILGALVLLFLIITVATFLFKPSRPAVNNSIQSAPTPTPSGYQYRGTTTPSKQQFNLIEVNPAPGSKDIAVSSAVTFKFDKNISAASITAASEPNVLYEIEKNNNVVTISPKEVLQPGVFYTFTVNVTSNGKSELFNTYFDTIGLSPSLTPTPTVKPYDITSFIEEQKQSRPDIFLKNRVPFSNSYFSITADFTSTPTEHFRFQVTLKGDKTTAKQQFISWLTSESLTQDQISRLDIIYQ